MNTGPGPRIRRLLAGYQRETAFEAMAHRFDDEPASRPTVYASASHWLVMFVIVLVAILASAHAIRYTRVVQENRVLRAQNCKYARYAHMPRLVDRLIDHDCADLERAHSHTPVVR